MLLQAVGDLLPAAVGVALSPIPIIAVVLMLGTPRARATGPAFVVGWIVGLVVVSALVLLIAGGADQSGSASAKGVDGVKAALGILFLGMAAGQWRNRPKPGEDPAMPAWMAKVDSMGPASAFGLGALLSGVNPKNLTLTIGASASIAEAGLSTSATVVAVAVYVAIGSISVAGPVLYYLVNARQAARLLSTVKDFMSANNAVIMMIVLLVLGAKLFGEGVSGLAS